MPAPWWAAAILALAWLLIPALAEAQTAKPDFGVKHACQIQAWVGTRTKRTVYTIHTRRLGKSATIAEIPMEEGLVVTITGVRGWWMLATAVHNAKGKRLFRGKGWVWSRLLVQRLRDKTKFHKRPAETSGVLVEAPDDTRVQLRGCRKGWSLIGWRHKRGWIAPVHQCPSKGRRCLYGGKPS